MFAMISNGNRVCAFVPFYRFGWHSFVFYFRSIVLETNKKKTRKKSAQIVSISFLLLLSVLPITRRTDFHIAFNFFFFLNRHHRYDCVQMILSLLLFIQYGAVYLGATCVPFFPDHAILFFFFSLCWKKRFKLIQTILCFFIFHCENRTFSYSFPSFSNFSNFFLSFFLIAIRIQS